MNFLYRTPFVRLLLALVSGIILFQYIQIPMYILILGFLVSFLLSLLHFFTRNADIQFRFRWVFGFFSAICFSIIGYVTCLFFQENNQFTELNHRAIYEVELTSSPVEKERSYSASVKLLQRYDSAASKKASGNAIVYFQKDSVRPGLLLGDRILIDAEFKSPDGVQNPMGFDYAKYLKRQGVGATVYIASGKWKKIGQNPAFSIRRFANKCRDYLLEIYKKYNITGKEFGVLAALTLGYTDSLDQDTYTLYSHTGAVHILSVSGLHVAIVYGAIFFLLGFLKRNRKQIILRALISILFIWAYAVITGLSPAVLRAALMLTFVALGTCLNRKPQIYNTVLASAFILLIFKPNLLFNIGFQLSYTAVLSIIAFQKSISNLYSPKNKLVKWFWNLTAVSIAAQLGTAPISIFYFNQFPNYFLLTNYAAIPLSTGIIYLAILLLFVSFIPFVATGVGFLLKWLIWSMNYALALILKIPGSVSVISITTVQLALLVAAILFFIAFSFKRRYFPLITALGFVLLFILSFAYRQYESVSGSKFIVFSDSRASIVNFIDGKDNFVFTTDEARAKKTGNAFWRASLVHEPQLIERNNWFDSGFAEFKGKRILILKDDLLKYKTTQTPLNVDYLIITNKVKPKMEQILTCVHPKLVIVDKSISQWYTNHVREVCNSHQIRFYSVAEKGAFVEEFR